MRLFKSIFGKIEAPEVYYYLHEIPEEKVQEVKDLIISLLYGYIVANLSKTVDEIFKHNRNYPAIRPGEDLDVSYSIKIPSDLLIAAINSSKEKLR